MDIEVTRERVGLLVDLLVLVTLSLVSSGCGGHGQQVITLTPSVGSARGPLRFALDAASPLSPGSTYDVQLAPSGENGWAVGAGGVVLHYDREKGWLRDELASTASGGVSVRAVRLEENGEKGWAVGDEGVVLHYEREKGWQKDEKASTESYGRKSLRALWLGRSGEVGWAVGKGGVVLHYDRENGWFHDDPASASSGGASLYGLWFDEKGEKGWAVGGDLWDLPDAGGLVLQYDQEKGWRKDEAASKAIGGDTLRAVWMDENGDEGWAVGDTVMHYTKSKGWQRDEVALAARGADPLYALWLDKNGQEGWAVGGELQGVVLHYHRATGWRLNSRGGRPIRALWIDASGEKGWAFSVGGVVVHYEREKGWLRDEPASKRPAGGVSLRAVRLDTSGEKGWAVGEQGTVLHYQREKGWQKDEKASTETDGATLYALWLDKSGKKGWAVGGGWPSYEQTSVVLQYGRENGWRRDKAASEISGVPLRALWLDKNSEQGWAVGGGFPQLLRDNIVVMHYDRAKGWGRDKAASASSNDNAPFDAVWLDESGKEGWAVSNGPARDAGGSTTEVALLHYERGGWHRDEAASAAASGRGPIYALWLDDKGEKGWAVGGGGVVLHYDRKTGWLLDQIASAASSSAPLYALWLDEKRGKGWAVGGGGVVLHYEQTKGWLRDQAASAAGCGVPLYSLWLDEKGETGWAVGDEGVLLSITTRAIGGTIDPGIQDFTKPVKLQFDSFILPDSLNVNILDSDGVPIVPDDPQHITVQPRREQPGLYEITFSEASRKIGALDELKGKPFQLQIVEHFGSQMVTLEPETTLYVKGSYWLTPYILVGVTVVLLNLFLVVGAIYSSKVRRFALDPTVRAIVGIGFLKYIVTEPLLVHVPPIRNALFREYRAKLPGLPQLAQWYQRKYLLPSIESSPFQFQPDAKHLVPEISSKADRKHSLPTLQPREVFETMLEALSRPEHNSDGAPRENAAGDPVWIVEGQSGLGKSALLQQVALAALASGKTPLYILLGNDQAAAQEVANLMSEWGDMNVSASVALDMVDGGGFVVLLDAFNEDRDPQSTLDFVRKAKKRNLVLLSSQFQPAWPSIQLKPIILKPFGREQLGQLLPEEWVERVLAAQHLSEVVRLPITAVLLREYISRRKAIPPSDYAIYQSLAEGLEPNQTVNLEQTAWELFKKNQRRFESDDHLPADFCDIAVRRNVLTVRSEPKKLFYQFVHDKVHRYFVACYLALQNDLPLAEWHKRLEPRQQKKYWTDVLEFRAAMFALSDQPVKARSSAYTKFILEVAEFDARIFASRLYSQYIRYRDAGYVNSDHRFEQEATTVLAKAVTVST